MNKSFLVLIFPFLFSLLISCSHHKHIVYIDDIKKGSVKKIDNYNKNKIEIGDVLKIDINTAIPETSIPYNSIDNFQSNLNSELLVVSGYLVEQDSVINYPILGKIYAVGFSESELAFKIKNLLVDLGHLTNPHVKVKKINSKFTVLGEVRNPGTFTYYDNKLNIFQAFGVAGDLLITAKRNNVKLIRQENGLTKVYKFSLSSSKLIDKPYYNIKSNDVIIIEPNFSKIKSAGFVGSPASIASISSLLLSITLLIINK